VISVSYFDRCFAGTSKVETEAARRNVDEPSVANAPVDNSTNWSLTPRAGRILRQLLGVNEAILCDSGVPLGPSTVLAWCVVGAGLLEVILRKCKGCA
jgi:hypothetical protein